MNSGLDIKNVGNNVEEKEMSEAERHKEESLAIFKQSDEAIEAADKMLRGFELKLEDEKTRPGLTGPTGATLGTIINRGLDSAAETDPDKKAHYREVSLTSIAEVGVATLKTLFAGERRRRAEGKELLKKRK